MPAESLVMLEWFGSGLVAEESPNSAVRLVSEEENRRFAAALREALLESALEDRKPEAAAWIRAAFQLGELVLSRPGALFLSRMALPPHRPEAIQAGLILSLGPEADTFRSLFAALEPVLVKELSWKRGELGPLRLGGAELRLLPVSEWAPQVAYGLSGGYFVVAVGQGRRRERVEWNDRRSQAERWR